MIKVDPESISKDKHYLCLSYESEDTFKSNTFDPHDLQSVRERQFSQSSDIVHFETRFYLIGMVICQNLGYPFFEEINRLFPFQYI